MVVVEAFHQAVGAKQEDVPGLVTDRADLGVNELISAAEGLLQNVSAWVSAGFALVDLALAQKPADMGVVVGELLDGAGPRGQIIDPAVADVAEVKPGGCEPA